MHYVVAKNFVVIKIRSVFMPISTYAFWIKSLEMTSYRYLIWETPCKILRHSVVGHDASNNCLPLNDFQRKYFSLYRHNFLWFSRTLTSYMMWQVSRSLSTYLSKSFRDATKILRKALFGSEGTEESWRYCVTDTNNAVGKSIEHSRISTSCRWRPTKNSLICRDLYLPTL